MKSLLQTLLAGNLRNQYIQDCSPALSAPSTGALLERPASSVTNLSRRFGNLTTVNQVSFTIHQGEILGLIGPNGAGKTTLFNSITGLQEHANSPRSRGWPQGSWESRVRAGTIKGSCRRGGRYASKSSQPE
jgi:energy-coupling factor transporter ATP-binding protein EcfA2